MVSRRILIRTICVLVLLATGTLLLSGGSIPSRTAASPASVAVALFPHATTTMMNTDLPERAWYSGKTSSLRVPPPERADQPRLQSATIVVNYVTGVYPPFQEYCQPWPSEARAAFEYAAGIWESLITSSVPIVIDACWGQMQSDNTLGYSAPYNYFLNFDGAPRSDTYYAVSLANALSGEDLDPQQADMYIAYNSSWADTGRWYFGTDGNPGADQMDFASIVLHEITHGLGFIGSMNVYNSIGLWGNGGTNDIPDIFDVFAQNGSGQRLIDTSVFPNSSTALAAQLTGGDLYFSGLYATSAAGGSVPALYAPSSWNPGSSFYHLDEIYNGTVNDLMTWAADGGASVHHPGPITLGILQDMGWRLDTGTPPDVEPSLAVSPATGPAGTQFLYTGSNFVAGETVTVWLVDPNGNRVDGPTPTANSQGQVTGTWNSATGDPTGTYTLFAEGSTGNQTVQVTFEVTASSTTPTAPTLTVEPTSGPVGTQFAYTGASFEPGETVMITLIDPQGTSYQGPARTADDQGAISGAWLIDASDPTGEYTIYAIGNQSQQTAAVSFTVTAASTTPSDPTISVTPVWDTNGTQFTWEASGFVPGDTLSLWLTDPAGNRSEAPDLVLDSQGAASNWLVPDSGVGSYLLSAQGSQNDQPVRTSFTVLPASDPAQRATYTGTFMNTSVGKSGNVTLDLALGNDQITGMMNFSNNPGSIPLCGAGELVGTRDDNQLVWHFSSNDTDTGCGFETGNLFSIEGSLSSDASTIVGNYTVSDGLQSQQGTFMVSRESSDSDTNTPSSVVNVQTNDNGMATATLHAGTTADVAMVVGVTEDILNMVNVTFVGTEPQGVEGQVYLPLVLRGWSYTTQREARAAHNPYIAASPLMLAPTTADSTSDEATIRPATIGDTNQVAYILLETADKEIPADGQSSTTITVWVEDANGDPVGGQIVTLGTTLGTLSTVYTPDPGEPPPDSVTVTGPDNGEIGDYYVFDATVTPADVVSTVSYHWTPEPVIGQGGSSAIFAWETAGEKQVTVEAVNSAGSVRDTTTITIADTMPDVAPAGMTIDGPTTGEIAASYLFTATVVPTTTTTPIDYTWDIGADQVIHNGKGQQDSVTMTWSSPGTKPITVTASNEFGTITETHTVVITDAMGSGVMPTGITIDGPTSAVMGVSSEFTATVSPDDTTMPITFTWYTDTSQITNTRMAQHDLVSITWNSPGTKTITVTAQNSAGMVTETHTIVVNELTALPEVQNSGFESGDNGDWATYSEYNLILIQDNTTLPIVPHSGEWAAWLGGQNAETNGITQEFTFPSGVSSLSLRFFYQVGTQEPACSNDGSGDLFTIFVDSTPVGWMELCPDTATSDWSEASLDLSDYAGQTVSLSFQVDTDSVYNSNIFLDDISFVSPVR